MIQGLLIARTQLELTIILLGFMANQIGVWKIASQLLPDRRIYQQLREEAYRFIDLVRKLNWRAVDGDAAGMEETKRKMHDAVERLAQVAGVAAQKAR